MADADIARATISKAQDGFSVQVVLRRGEQIDMWRVNFVVREVTEWALPGLDVPVLRDGHVRGAAARRARGLGVLRGGAERRRGGADRVRERAAGAGRAGDGHAAGRAGLAGLGGQGQRPAGGTAGQAPVSTMRCARRWPPRTRWPRTRPR